MRRLGLVAPLMAMAVVSAIAVVVAKHESRRAFVELQELHRQRDRLNVEWGRLRIEQGTIATQSRIERIARHRWNMHRPMSEDVIIVREAATKGARSDEP